MSFDMDPRDDDPHGECKHEIERLATELAAAREGHEKACCLVADMHKAAMGEVCGPKRGVVEDVSDLRDEADRLRKDRYALLNVKTKDGLLASEWVMRTATAEAELAKLREQISKCRICSETMKLDALERQDFVEAQFWRKAAAGRGEGER